MIEEDALGAICKTRFYECVAVVLHPEASLLSETRVRAKSLRPVSTALELLKERFVATKQFNRGNQRSHLWETRQALNSGLGQRMMHLPTVVTEGLGWLAFQFMRIQPFIATYIQILLSAVFLIYIASHASLSRPSSAAPSKKRRHDSIDLNSEEDDNDERSPFVEGLAATDAIAFPLYAGAVLTGLYFLIKWLQNPAIINTILNAYFAVFSVFAVCRLISDSLDVFHSVLFPHNFLHKGVIYYSSANEQQSKPLGQHVPARQSPLPGIFSTITFPGRINELLWALHVLPSRKLEIQAKVRNFGETKIRLGIHGVEGLAVGLIAVVYYNFIGKTWWLTNLMGFGFSYGAMQFMSPTTFTIGSLVLTALFFYDIFFVFYTPVMVSVATSLDVPIKLVFPRPPEPDMDPLIRPLAMLGLGDIVLPGLMVGLALRFDLFMHYWKKQTKQCATESDAQPDSKQIADHDDNLEDTVLISVDQVSEDTASDEAKTITPEPNNAFTVVKAKFVPVSGGWGDRFWTWTLFGSPPSTQNYQPRGVFPKPYFHVSILSYVFALTLTMLIMHYSGHAQPALLYLVPCVLSSLWATAWLRGELGEMLAFSDDPEDDQASHKAKDVDAESAEEQDGLILKPFKALWREVFPPKPSAGVNGNAESGSASTDREDDKKSEEHPPIKIESEKQSSESETDDDRTLISFKITLPPLRKTSSSVHQGDRSTGETFNGTEDVKHASANWSPANKKVRDRSEHADKRQRIA